MGQKSGRVDLFETGLNSRNIAKGKKAKVHRAPEALTTSLKKSLGVLGGKKGEQEPNAEGKRDGIEGGGVNHRRAG